MGQENGNFQNDEKKIAPTTTSYKMRPSLGETFKGIQIKQIVREVMFEKLQGTIISIYYTICNVYEIRISSRKNIQRGRREELDKRYS